MKTAKKNIDYFIHKTKAYRDGKFKMLRKSFGWEGDAKFWALNCIIGEATDCMLDLSKEYDRIDICDQLEMTEEEFDRFIDFLDSKVNLIRRDGDRITTS